MPENKRYYWLKLKRDFFKRHDIRIIESMPNGKDYILFYLKLLLESIDHEGQLRFSETIPYDENMLSIITNTNIDVVRSALNVFEQLSMLEVMDDRTIYMEEAAKMLGCEGWSAERVRNHRKNQLELTNALQCNNSVTKCNLEIEIEKELEIDPSVSKKKKHKYGEYHNVLLTDEELQKLKDKFSDYESKIQNFSEGIELKGYVYKNHYLAILKWAANEKGRSYEAKLDCSGGGMQM